jgi:hypothetical protein
MKSINVLIDISLGVELWSKWNYVIDIYSQPINSSILKNLCQGKNEIHMNKKIMNVVLIQHQWLACIQERIDQVLFLSNKYLWKQLDHMKKTTHDSLIQQKGRRFLIMSL